MGSEGRLLAPSLEAIKQVKTEQGEMLTKPFLDLCKLLVLLIEKFGPAMSAVACDIRGNLLRLQERYYSDPSKYRLLFGILQGEIEAKSAKKPSSCTNSLLWLTRSMDFLVDLFKNLIEHSEWSMKYACIVSYNKTLKRWHGWLTRSTFMIALKIVPERKKVMEILGESASVDTEKFCTLFVPLLEAIHKLFASVDLDSFKSS